MSGDGLTGTIKTKTFKDGIYLIEVANRDGSLRYRKFEDENGLQHNPAGPSFESWCRCGLLDSRHFSIHGVWHNTCGPAIELWDCEGNLEIQDFWIDGQKLTEEEFLSLQPTKSALKR